MYNFVKTYFYVDDECSDKKSADADMENEIISGLSVLYNADILREMLGYLVDCKRTFKKAEKEREKAIAKAQANTLSHYIVNALQDRRDRKNKEDDN